MSRAASSSTPDLVAGALSVSELTGSIKSTLELGFRDLSVHGEVIGVTHARSGHVYFTLKDDDESGGDAQISVVMWRTRARSLRFRLEDGMRVVVLGRLTVYEPRGVYQIVADEIRPAGQGTLLVAFERLKRRLWDEGLFAPERKRPLPRFPSRIGLVTSPTGAAVHDVLRSVLRKFPARVRIAPARVQGEGAAEEIARALEFFNDETRERVDVIIVARGGGSLDDLWAFNEERVARAIAASGIPVVSGVGHEVDVTLADLAADVRAQTPTHAGEVVVESHELLATSIVTSERRLREAFRRRWERARDSVRRAGEALSRHSPRRELERVDERVATLGSALQKALYNRLQGWQDQVEGLAARLRALSPLDVLARGYALARREDGSILRSARDAVAGEELTVRLASGELRVRIIERIQERGAPDEA